MGLREFQTMERRRFMDAQERVAQGEHCLEWTDVHRRFIELIDVHIKGFLEEVHCSDEEFMNALVESKKSGSASSFALFSMLLNTGDYECFARMLQSNTCLCCGNS